MSRVVSELDKKLIEIGCAAHCEMNLYHALEVISSVPELYNTFVREYKELVRDYMKHHTLDELFDGNRLGFTMNTSDILNIIDKQILEEFGGYTDKVLKNFRDCKYCGMSCEDAHTRIMADVLKG